MFTKDCKKILNKKENETFKQLVLKKKDINQKNSLINIENGHCHIPEGVISIGNNCFDGCSSLTNIQLPLSLLSIGDYAFKNTNISTITIPEGVTSIGDYCFNWCSSLTSVELPSSLISIGKYPFSNTSLHSVTVPKNCKVDDLAFDKECKVEFKDNE